MLIKIIYTFSKLEAEVSPCSLFSVLKLKAMLIYTLLPEIETNKKLSCIWSVNVKCVARGDNWEKFYSKELRLSSRMVHDKI